jgi:hypothetical protein
LFEPVRLIPLPLDSERIIQIDNTTGEVVKDTNITNRPNIDVIAKKTASSMRIINAKLRALNTYENIDEAG